ncbi:hypothetical protein [Epilithonimonas zeae]|uniref:hypothetical protein n=1 Tax=Epilithonimonas zeae TaxID=1416779 RepID=UPI00200EC330|nr:hypothetical protein [Epilithonimonas zeae]UQB68978.1 hypothetical protein KI430_00600 [Epilithonimonas zeae]
MLKIWGFFAFLTVSFGNAQSKNAFVQANLNYDNYCNVRFQYCVDYPIQLMTPEPESSNGDGRIFTNHKHEETLRVFGRNNLDAEGRTISLKQQFDADLKSLAKNTATKITYQKRGKTFFVISGYKNGKIFYQKTILKNDAFAYAILQYDENERTVFDKISTNIFKSFK